MKKRCLLSLAIFFFSPLTVNAADLLEVYQQAVTSDPIYQQAIAQRLSTKEGVPINVAALLPNVQLLTVPSVTKSYYSGATSNPNTNTARQLAMTLTITQTVFNLAQFASVGGAIASSKGADATLNAATQNLMIRVTSAYFAILQDEETLRYNEATKRAYAQQLDQIKQQFDVGIKTITDVYTAQASYDSAVANTIAAQTQLDNDRENLRVIAGKYYSHLAQVSEEFPLTSPQPAYIEQWVDTARRQNWSIKAAQYTLDNALYNIRQQYAGHFPTVNVEGTLDRIVTKNINSSNSVLTQGGSTRQIDRAVELNINLPIFEGGQVVAQTNQAIYNYQVAEQQLEQTMRGTVNTTRQSYLGVVSGISQIKADKQTIKSSISSVNGMEESYRVGTETLVNVLNQRQKAFEAQTEYAKDRYAYVNNLLALKQAAGTLSFDDLRVLNAWLIERDSNSYHSNIPKIVKIYPAKKSIKNIVTHFKSKKIARKMPTSRHAKKFAHSSSNRKQKSVVHRV